MDQRILNGQLLLELVDHLVLLLELLFKMLDDVLDRNILLVLQDYGKVRDCILFEPAIFKSHLLIVRTNACEICLEKLLGGSDTRHPLSIALLLLLEHRMFSAAWFRLPYL